MEYGDRARFLKIDTDEEHELANQMQVRSSLPHTSTKMKFTTCQMFFVATLVASPSQKYWSQSDFQRY